MQTAPHTFAQRDLVAGHVVLDLVNTVTARNAVPIDWLEGYPRLLEWASLTGQFDAAALHALHEQAMVDPPAAARALGRIRLLRETLLEVLSAIIQNETPSAGALDRLERQWKEAVAHAQLGGSGRQVGLQLSPPTSGLDYLTHDLTLRSLALLAALPLARTRVCPGTGCGWLFIDRSRGGQRRWCDMSTCGNAAKSRAHAQRRRRRAHAHPGH